MSARKRLLAGAAAAALGLVQAVALPATAALGPAGASKYRTVHPQAPKAGSTYKGLTVEGGDLTVNIADRKTVQVVAFRFDCVGSVTGRTSLQDIPIKKTKTAYKLGIHSFGTTTYSDGTDQSAEVVVWGRFSPNAKRLSGHVRVTTKRCGNTGDIDYSASIG